MLSVLETLSVHVAVVAMWCMAAGLVAGIGWLAHRAIGGDGSGPQWAGTVWTGLAVVVAFLHAWHVVRPIDAFALLSVVVAGATGLVAGSARSAQPLQRVRVDARSMTLAFIALWLANRSLAPLNAHDTLMYMLPGVEWAREFPAVPGLGALHGRLGFNSSNLLLAALVEAGPWPRASPHLVAGFFLLLLAATALRKGPDKDDARVHAATIFDRLLLVPLFAMALDDQLMPSLSADVGVAVALLCATSALLHGTPAAHARAGDESRRQEAPRQLPPRGPDDQRVEWLGAASASVVAVTLKLSAAMMGAALWIVAIHRLSRGARTDARARRAVALTVALALGGLGLWVNHGVITSGYPFYPSTVLPAPVSWRVPAEQSAAESAWIGHFARSWPSTAVAHAGDVTGMRWSRFAWLPPWIGALARGEDRGVVSAAFLLILVLSPLALARLARDHLRHNRQDGRAPHAAGAAPAARASSTVSRRRIPALPATGIVACAIAGTLFWFVTAPRPTFGVAGPWVLAGLLLGSLLAGVRPRAARRITLATVGVLCLLVAANDVRIDEPGLVGSMAAWRWTLLRDADPADWFREPDVGEMVAFTTREGAVLSVPAQGNLCGRTPPPCTPHPSENLAWRSPGQPANGFVIRGDWEPLRWPRLGSRFLAGWRATR